MYNKMKVTFRKEDEILNFPTDIFSLICRISNYNNKIMIIIIFFIKNFYIDILKFSFILEKA